MFLKTSIKSNKKESCFPIFHIYTINKVYNKKVGVAMYTYTIQATHRLSVGYMEHINIIETNNTCIYMYKLNLT